MAQALGCTFTRALALSLAAAWLCASPGPARAQSGSSTPADTRTVASADHTIAVDAEIKRCFELRRASPGQAIVLADRLLASGALDPANEIKTQSCLGMAASYTGEPERALQAVARVETLLDAHPMPADFALRAVSNAGAILHGVGHIDAALQAYGRAYALAEADDTPKAQLVTLLNIGIIYSEELRAYGAADGFYRRARALGTANGIEDPSLDYNQAQNLLRMGETDAALRMFALGAAIASRTGDTLLELRARSELIALQPSDSGPGTRRERLASLAGQQLALPDVGGAVVTHTTLSKLALRDGDGAAALAHADRAAQLVAATGLRLERVLALEARVAALRALGRLADALAVSTELRRFETSSMRAQSMRGLVELQARLDDGDRTREIDRLMVADQARVVVLERSQLLRDVALGGLGLLALGTLAFAGYQRRIQRRLETLSTVDPLTGLLNRRAASAQLMQARFTGHGTADHARRATLFLVDIDHFKEVNDRHGHGIGDAVLVEVARRLLAGCRPGDLVSRWGGEEFLVACSRLDLDGAMAIATRLRASVAQGAIVVDGRTIDAPVVSVGFACWPFFPGAPQAGSAQRGWQDAVAVADHALYAVKRGGRDGWIGLWGNPAVRLDVAAFLADPAAAITRGDVALVPEGLAADWTLPASGSGRASGAADATASPVVGFGASWTA